MLNSLFLFFLPVAVFAFKAEDHKFTPTFGSGSAELNMSVNSVHDYSATNRNYLFAGLGVDDLSLQLKFPMKDPEESRRGRVDSKITDYQMGYRFNGNYQTHLYFQKYTGYYVQSGLFGEAKKDLSFSHQGADVVYTFNPKFSSAVQEDSVWEQKEDGGSWMLSAGLDNFDIDGEILPNYRDFNQFIYPQQVQEQKIIQPNAANIRSLSLRAGYGYNWLWTHWFCGVSFGGGTNLNYISTQYDAETKKTVDSKMNYSYSLSYGYRWTATKVGVFARVVSWTLQLDDIDMTSRTQSTGLYISSAF